jgi:hypothetical protein
MKQLRFLLLPAILFAASLPTSVPSTATSPQPSNVFAITWRLIDRWFWSRCFERCSGGRHRRLNHRSWSCRSRKHSLGATVIDAKGLVLAPGFIDTHNHSDRGLANDPAATTQVSQGITTISIGQDGGSPFPVGEYLSNLDRDPVAINVLTFVGHATLRSKVMGDNTNRHATTEEIEKMRALVDQAMRDGAFGLSTGLEYEVGKPATD